MEDSWTIGFLFGGVGWPAMKKPVAMVNFDRKKLFFSVVFWNFDSWFGGRGRCPRENMKKNEWQIIATNPPRSPPKGILQNNLAGQHREVKPQAFQHNKRRRKGWKILGLGLGSDEDAAAKTGGEAGASGLTRALMEKDQGLKNAAGSSEGRTSAPRWEASSLKGCRSCARRAQKALNGHSFTLYFERLLADDMW